MPAPDYGPDVVPAWGASDAPRDRIVAAACTLFNKAGIRAVGVDAIVAEAGVARGTFYRYFASKDDLVLAFLERSDREWRSWLASAVSAAADTPRGRLTAVFSVLPAWFDSPTFRGSPNLNAAAEVGGDSKRVADVARAHSEHVRSFLAGLAAQDGAPRPDEVARRLQLVLNGAIATAQLAHDPAGRRAAACDAEALARSILETGGD